MSNTRYAKEGQPRTQQGFCSSVEYERGLLGNAVAMRCESLDNARAKEIVLALQYISWQPGGLKDFARKMRERFETELITPAMKRFGVRANQVYNASQVRAIRAEIPDGEQVFLLKGEKSDLACITGDRVWEMERKAERQPENYEAAQLVSYCRARANGLADWLSNLCLDPAIDWNGASPWWFPTLAEKLDLLVSEIAKAEAAEGYAATEISEQVFGALEYCAETKELTPIYGLARTGKTSAAKEWCKRNPGRARYVQVPPTTDDASFMRRIAEALGVGAGLSYKNTQIRERVERTARIAGLMLVLDEGHNLLTQDYRARRRPSRISWLMTELVNYGVPVAFLATPQFEEDKQRIKDRTGWNWDQFDGRIGIPVMLPKEISKEDLAAVAKARLPAGDQKSINALVAYALWSNSQLAGIDHIVTRAQFTARKAGRGVSFEDIAEAIKRRSPTDQAAPNSSRQRTRQSFRSISPAAPAIAPRRGQLEAVCP